MESIYDVIILGAGPAGLSAGLYAGRSRLKTLIIEKLAPGGQIAITDEIENYPGSVEHETGPSLVKRMAEQAKKFGAEFISDTVLSVELGGDVKQIRCADGEYRAKTVIAATGVVHKPIGCIGEKELTGKGISYCATCDAAFFEGLEVYVVGGGDAAVEEALYLTRFARSVTLIHRRDQLRAAKSIQQKAFANEKMHFFWDTVVEELRGDGLLESMILRNVKTGERREIVADEDDGTFGVFVFVGFEPAGALFEGQLTMKNGYLVTDDDMKTNLPGVFAAGDIRVKSLRQVVTAVSDGAIAAVQAERYLEGL
ncbi:MAG TPA: thioredoxin-disulfide reductase [Clostridia bacterium]|nr:thioredoxin-disulfide reductase [Clostridia bacterium]